jgi:tRNA(adenine34) deaminase
MDNKYMILALKEAEKAFKKDDVPVGAVIVKNSKIISKAHNLREKKNDATCHAEILAISKACRKLKSWRLTECILYVTLEPCSMCKAAISQARIDKVIYGTDSKKEYEDKFELIKSDNFENECSSIVQTFFQKKRNK